MQKDLMLVGEPHLPCPSATCDRVLSQMQPRRSASDVRAGRPDAGGREYTRRNLEQEIAGFHAQAAAGEHAMQARPMLTLDPSSSQECLRPVNGAHVTPVVMRVLPWACLDPKPAESLAHFRTV